MSQIVVGGFAVQPPEPDAYIGLPLTTANQARPASRRLHASAGPDSKDGGTFTTRTVILSASFIIACTLIYTGHCPTPRCRCVFVSRRPFFVGHSGAAAHPNSPSSQLHMRSTPKLAWGHRHPLFLTLQSSFHL